MGEETKNALDNLRVGQDSLLSAIQDSSKQMMSTASDAAITATTVAHAAEKTALIGAMGITKAMWALIGNSSAMMIIVVVMLVGLWQVQAMHQQAVGILTDIIIATRKQADDIRQDQNRVIDSNTAAIKDLAMEVKALRMERRDK